MTRDISEMTAEELHARKARLQAEIKEVDLELARKSGRVVTWPHRDPSGDYYGPYGFGAQER